MSLGMLVRLSLLLSLYVACCRAFLPCPGANGAVAARAGGDMGLFLSSAMQTPVARRVMALEAKKKQKGGSEGAAPRERKQKDDVIEVEGVVKESLPGAMFRVEVGATNQVILCTISGKIRKNFVRILVGDPVRVELSPYDLTRGRISFRYKK
ncbi:unnamed protein product [Chrysoparadoxa australica]